MKISMNYLTKLVSLLSLLISSNLQVSGSVGQDTFAIHSVGHGSLYFEYKDLIIHVDPYSTQADYSQLPDADLIFVTHHHGDHYDLNALNHIKTDSTVMIFTQAVKNLGTYTDSSIVMNNGDSISIKGISVKAVPAYNAVTLNTYHIKGVCNGYIFAFGEKRIYVAGDTEIMPEMDTFGDIDIAFIPMNLPFTMPVSMAADAARKVNPDILYIYHFGTSDTAALRDSLSNTSMEIRMGKSVYYESDKKTVTNTRNLTKENANYFYPNPVKNSIIINNPSPGSLLTICNITGRVLLKMNLQNSGKQTIDLRSLKPGTYIVRIQDKGVVKSRLLMKE
jgi:L-ascorbate metabolism protein UlaG (beta-lactamase superfamily)